MPRPFAEFQTTVMGIQNIVNALITRDEVLYDSLDDRIQALEAMRLLHNSLFEGIASTLESILVILETK